MSATLFGFDILKRWGLSGEPKDGDVVAVLRSVRRDTSSADLGVTPTGLPSLAVNASGVKPSKVLAVVKSKEREAGSVEKNVTVVHKPADLAATLKRESHAFQGSRDVAFVQRETGKLARKLHLERAGIIRVKKKRVLQHEAAQVVEVLDVESPRSPTGVHFGLELASEDLGAEFRAAIVAGHKLCESWELARLVEALLREVVDQMPHVAADARPVFHNPPLHRKWA